MKVGVKDSVGRVNEPVGMEKDPVGTEWDDGVKEPVGALCGK